MAQPYYRFDSISDKISIGDVSALPVGISDYSIEGLVRFNNATAGMVILGDSDSNANNFVRMMLWGEDSAVGKLRFDGHTASPNQYNWIISTPENVVEAGKWHHIVGVVDRDTSGNCGIWVDGIKVSDTVSNLDSGANSHDFNNFNIGIDYAGNYDFNGQIARVRAFNVALSDDEVKELYSGADVPFKYKGADQTNNIAHTGWVGASDSSAGTGWTPDTDADYSSTADGGHNNMPILAIERQADTTQFTYTYPNQTANGSNIDPTLIVGKKYRASIWVKSGTAGNVGATFHIYRYNWGAHPEGQPSDITSSSSWQEMSLEFIAEGGGTDGIFMIKSHITSGTTLTQKWSDPKIVQLGCVGEWDGSGIASDKWFDKSGNDLHGTVTNATVENAPSGDSGLVYEEGRIENPYKINGKIVYSERDDGGGIPANDLSCVYRRIGDVVHCWYLTDTSGQNLSQWKDSSGNEVGTGQIELNLPFASAGYNYVQNAQHMYYHGTSTTVYTYMAPATSTVGLYTNVDQSTALATADNESRIIFRCYFCYNLTGIGLAS
tara:strand:- start:149 stop:1798 length:1650 start_codon:yes stop_codon:yes gene_type:complete